MKRPNRLAPWLMLGVIGIFFSVTALAARVGRVESGQVLVLSKPNSSGGVVETLNSGTRVLVSNKELRGYVKVKTPSGRIGYVLANSLQISDGKPKDGTLSHKNYDSQNRAAIFVGMSFFNSKDLGDLAGFTGLSNGFHIGAEGLFGVSERVALGFRIEKISKTVTAVDDVTTKSYTMALGSMPVMAGVVYSMQGQKSSGTRLNFGLFAGMGLSTQAVLTGVNDDAPNETVLKQTPITFLLKSDLNFELSKTLGAMVEVGYRVLKTGEIWPTTVGNGSTLLQISGDYQAVAVSLSGFEISAGLTLAF